MRNLLRYVQLTLCISSRPRQYSGRVIACFHLSRYEAVCRVGILRQSHLALLLIYSLAFSILGATRHHTFWRTAPPSHPTSNSFPTSLQQAFLLSNNSLSAYPSRQPTIIKRSRSSSLQCLPGARPKRECSAGGEARCVPSRRESQLK